MRNCLELLSRNGGVEVEHYVRFIIEFYDHDMEGWAGYGMGCERDAEGILY